MDDACGRDPCPACQHRRRAEVVGWALFVLLVLTVPAAVEYAGLGDRYEETRDPVRDPPAGPPAHGRSRHP
jgi:hypothetical protein